MHVLADRAHYRNRIAATIDSMASRAFRYAPLIVFGAVYTLSCLLGALLLIAEYKPFVALFEYFSGTAAPQLSSEETQTSLVLLIVAPLVLAAGYAALIELAPARKRTPSKGADAQPPGWLPGTIFTALSIIGLTSLVRGGALGRTSSWVDYGAWVQSRSETFAQISYLEFANLYILIPCAAAWVVVATTPRSRAQALLRWLPVPITLGLSLLLYTRKALLAALLIIVFAWIVDATTRGRPVRKFLLGGVGLVAAVYVILVVVPVYSDTSTTLREASAPAAAHDPLRARRIAAAGEYFDLANRRQAIVLYSLLSPLTRSSAPALYYPIVFPKEHDFFRLDLGLDIAGVGSMPNDNVVVWNYLNPDLPGGTTVVSYQFVLYSQIGTWGAVAASFVVGLLLALAWRLAQVPSRTTSSLLGAMVLLLATYLAIDSLRNSVVVSYGVIWGVLFALAAGMAVRSLPRWGLARTSLARPPLRRAPSASGLWSCDDSDEPSETARQEPRERPSDTTIVRRDEALVADLAERREEVV